MQGNISNSGVKYFEMHDRENILKFLNLFLGYICKFYPDFDDLPMFLSMYNILNQ